MIPGSDDLARMMSPQGSSTDLAFRQGVVVSWDESTGSNSVNVNGVILTNLPCLNLGEFAILQPGDVVGLLRVGSTYFIMGRLILPAGPDRNRASVGFESRVNSENGFSLTTSDVDRATVNIPVPRWADEAIVMCNAVCQAINSRNVEDFLQLAPTVNGNNVSALFFPAMGGDGTGFSGFVAGSLFGSTVINNPPSVITCSARVRVNGATWAANGSNFAAVSATAIFRRVD